MRNDYNKMYLEDVIMKKAQEKVDYQIKKGNAKDWTNKVYRLRAQSVAKQMKDRELKELGIISRSPLQATNIFTLAKLSNLSSKAPTLVADHSAD